ncbi:ABC transporter ATP-binding protein YtrB [Anaerotignum neopropionicum]|uniref:ABC transporter ATP-binding protein YtrB n=1 Tax=Anaerotignum neopropionicum TaxID=36847 RepID=A0A136WB01_9FIRM|nr:ABC transporter ATP-binding protein [Anaerotignum neopropionicum]KXL51693.1 ABC transporter ATP-binding protein YtrB [Anaerotignum neopropionicum]
MVEIKDLYFTYPNYQTVLENITFSVPTGQIVAVLGANGAGKTTLLKLIAGLLVPDGDVKVRIDGKTPQKISGKIAFISEAGTYFNDLTPKTYGAFLQDFFPTFDKAYFDMLLDFFQLQERPMKKMSKGQKAKVEIAAGMAKRTPYIIMDEPFVGKDMFTRQDFMQALSGTLTGEETIFITTHEIREIENFVDRVIILKENHIAIDITLDVLRQEGKTIQELMKEVIGYEENSFYSLLDKTEDSI